MSYDHIEQPDGQLFDRLQILRGLDQNWQSLERRTDISHEIGCIIFEQVERYSKTHTTFSELPTIEDFARNNSLTQRIEGFDLMGNNYD